MRFRHLTLGATAVLASHFFVGCGQSEPADHPEPNFTEEQAGHLDALVTDFVARERYPNIAIGVVIGGDLVWQKGLGAGPTPGSSPDAVTVFRAGPLSSIVTTTALLTLVEEGVLSLDDGASAWLPEASDVLAFPGMRPVTVRHLLSHTSGIPNTGNGSLTWHSHLANVTEADLFFALEGVRPSFEPGTDYEFSYLGMALVGVIIERASEASFRDYVRERVLRPLQLDASSWDPPATGLAPGHNMTRSASYDLVADLWQFGSVEPSAGLFSTVSDLARLASHALGYRSLLGPATLEESMTPALSRQGEFQGFGLGWRISESALLGKLAWHSGTTDGYASHMALAPGHDLGVVILAGTALFGDLMEVESLGRAILSYLVDEGTDLVPQTARTSQEAIDLVGQRLLGLINSPNPEDVVETFDPGLIESITVEGIVDAFHRFLDVTGTCMSYDVLEDFGYGSVVYWLYCAEGRVRVLMHTNWEFPYLAYGFLPH